MFLCSYAIPFGLKAEVEKEIDEMEKSGIIEKSNSPYNSPVVIVRKKDKGIRLRGDFRKLNSKTRFDAEPMFDQVNIFSKLSQSCYFSKLDLFKGFWQIPLEESSKQYTAFSTPKGLYHFRVLPFGLSNSPAVFNRTMRSVLGDLSNVEIFVDDILIHTTTFEDHLHVLNNVLLRLKDAGLVVNPSKCVLGQAELDFLGHRIGKGLCQPQEEKITKIVDASPPRTKKQVRSFLGLTGYYRTFIPNYATIV